MLMQRAIKLCQTVDQRPEEGCGVAACVHGRAWQRKAGGVTDFPSSSLQTPTDNKSSAEGRRVAWKPHARGCGVLKFKGGGVQRRHATALTLAKTKNMAMSRAPCDEDGQTMGTARSRNSLRGWIQLPRNSYDHRRSTRETAIDPSILPDPSVIWRRM